MLTPKRVPLRGVRYIASGAAHTAAVTEDATYTWGAGAAGGRGARAGWAAWGRVRGAMGL